MSDYCYQNVNNKNSYLFVRFSMYLTCRFSTAYFAIIYTIMTSPKMINMDPSNGVTIDTVSKLNPTSVESAANRKKLIRLVHYQEGCQCTLCQKCIFTHKL